jgi:hypothetical protein
MLDDEQCLLLFELGEVDPAHFPGLSCWAGTEISGFASTQDSVQILADAWVSSFDMPALRTKALSRVWSRYPESPAAEVNEPPFCTIADTQEEVVASAFDAYKSFVWAATFDTAGNYRVWFRSDHPSCGEQGFTCLVDFPVPPHDTGEMGSWLLGMNEKTKLIADRLQSALRFHKYSLGELSGLGKADGGKEGSNG